MKNIYQLSCHTIMYVVTYLPCHIRYTKQLIKRLQIVVFQVYNIKLVRLDNMGLDVNIPLPSNASGRT